TISIKIVCGQAQPHQTLPKTTVNRIMKTTNISNTKMSKCVSWGQKTAPKTTNFLSKKLSSSKGCPFIFKNGPANKMLNRKTVTSTRHRCNLPLGFFGYTHARLPLSSIVESESLNSCV